VNKLIILCFLVLGLGACSSAEKMEVDNAESAASQDVDSAKANAKDKAGSTEANMSASSSSCTMDQDTRVIEVKKSESGGCELFYTKFGEAKSVATSGFGTQYCEEVKDRIQTNLNKAGFTCK
jgi:hypothetical protein